LTNNACVANWFEARPTRSREVLAKFGVELPKPPPWIPKVVWIGGFRYGEGPEVRLTREALFERVWTEPVDKLARSWGLSGPGLSKACRRLRIPLPPRGYWAKLAAGRRPRRPALPALEPGEAEEIVIPLPFPPPEEPRR
jgi:hypothetical protein